MDDEKVQLLSSEPIQGYGLYDRETIEAALNEWESKGYLTIITNPDCAAPNEICVKMLSYIDRESPWPDWPPKS